MQNLHRVMTRESHSNRRLQDFTDPMLPESPLQNIAVKSSSELSISSNEIEVKLKHTQLQFENENLEKKQKTEQEEEEEEDVEICRASLRIESLQTYAIISSIVMGSGMALYGIGAEAIHDMETHLFDQILSLMLFWTVAASLLASVYSTVTFTLMALYYSTALGMGCDESYLSFDKATVRFRRHGFTAFIVSIGFFLCAAVLLFIIDSNGLYSKLFMSIAAGGFAIFSVNEFRTITKLAGEHIFKPLSMDSKVSKKAAARRSGCIPNNRSH